MAAAAETPQRTHLLEHKVSTLRQQRQHYAFLRSDASQLQQKVVREIGRIEAHTEELKNFLLQFVDEFCDAEALPHGEFKYRNFLVGSSKRRVASALAFDDPGFGALLGAALQCHPKCNPLGDRRFTGNCSGVQERQVLLAFFFSKKLRMASVTTCPSVSSTCDR